MTNDEKVKLLQEVREEVLKLVSGESDAYNHGVRAAGHCIMKFITEFQKTPNDLKQEYGMYHN